MGKSAKIRHRRRRRHERWTPAKAARLREALMAIIGEDVWTTTKAGFPYYLHVDPADADPLIVAYPAKRIIIQ